MIDPKNDGVDHINVYSKGATELGRWLTNFAYSPIVTEDGYFQSIEGYWYWLSCGDDALRNLCGWEAKAYGRKVKARDWQDGDEFKRKICSAISIKIYGNPEMRRLLSLSVLPMKHYYVYGGRVIEPKEGKWILEHLEELRLLSVKWSKSMCVTYRAVSAEK